jgi:hypothetical protein
VISSARSAPSAAPWNAIAARISALVSFEALGVAAVVGAAGEHDRAVVGLQVQPVGSGDAGGHDVGLRVEEQEVVVDPHVGALVEAHDVEVALDQPVERVDARAELVGQPEAGHSLPPSTAGSSTV